MTLSLFLVHVTIIDDYGLTWDFHHHFFAGLHLLGRPIDKKLTENIPFTEPSPLLTQELPFGPLMSITPVLSYQLFYEKLRLLAFDNAYNIAIVASGVAGIGILYFFLLEATNFPTALIAFMFLALLPRYFGDLHNNMKDVPQAAAFALAIWLFWRLVKYNKIKDLVIASLGFAIAFNTKVNTLAIPFIAFLSLRKFHPRILSYFFLAPLFALLIWIPFWQDPFGVLAYLPKFFQINTPNIEVLYMDKWYCSGVNVPWHYPLGYLAITTPLPLLLFFFIGLFRRPPSIFLLWFFVPLARYLIPKIGVIDGIRHFEEVVYPMSAIAAIGAQSIFQWIKQKTIVLVLYFLILYSLSLILITYHPFQISYFNELVGGIRGAYGRYDIDYWGGPQKQAINWINANVPQQSRIAVAMAADVAVKYIRPDLTPLLNTRHYNSSDYVVILNRQSFFYRYRVVDYLLTHTPIYTIENQGVPIVWIFDNHVSPAQKKNPWWEGTDPCIRL